MLIFSFIDWTSSTTVTRDKYELFAMIEQLLYSDYQEEYKYSFIQEIVRFQTYFAHILDMALDCLRSANPVLTSTVIAQLNHVIHQLPPNYSVYDTIHSMHSWGQHDVSLHHHCNRSNIALVVQYYIPSDPAIAHNVNTALIKNIYQPCIRDIYVLTETALDMSVFSSEVAKHKVHQYVIGKRMTYYDAVHFSNEWLAGRIVIIGM